MIDPSAFEERLVRRERILELREQRWTLARIGERYGLTRERVRQIIRKPVRQVIRKPIGASPEQAKAEPKANRQATRSKRTIFYKYLDADLMARFSRLYQPGMSANRLAVLAKTQWVHAQRYLTARNIAAPRIETRKKREL